MPKEPRPRPGSAIPAGAESADVPDPDRKQGPGWTLLTSHGRVLLLIARDPDLRVREMAGIAQISERSAASIVRDLETEGYITKVRVGRRNRYIVHDELAFRHPAEAEHRVRELIEVFTSR